MDEARLSEIEHRNRCSGHDILPGADTFYCGPDNADIAELLAEVRRLQAREQETVDWIAEMRAKHGPPGPEMGSNERCFIHKVYEHPVCEERRKYYVNAQEM